MPQKKQHWGLRASRAADKLGIGASTLWACTKREPGFPQPLEVGPNTTIRIEEELDAFIERQFTGSRGIARVSVSSRTGGHA